MKGRTRSFRLALGCLAAAGVSLGAWSWGFAADEKADEIVLVQEGEELLAGRVRGLLRELSADPWRRRGRAQEMLVEMGEAALPWVERFLKGEIDEEARVRAEEVAQRIRRNVEEGPTYVSMDVMDVSVAEAYAELSRGARLATPIRFSPRTDSPLMPIIPGIPEWRRPGSGKTVTMKVDRQPFWAAFRELSAKAGTELVPSQEPGALLLREGNNAWPFRPASYSGPFMLSAMRIDLQGGFGPGFHRVRGRTEYSLGLVAFGEPKLRPVSWSIVRIDACVDELGQSLIDLSRNNMAAMSPVNSNAEKQVALLAPAEPGKRIERLELTARFTLEVKSESVEVFDVTGSRGRSYPLGAMQFRVTEFQELSEFRYSMTFTVTRDGRSDPEWGEVGRLVQRNLPKVFDEEGRALESVAMSPVMPNEREYARTFQVRRTGRAGPPTRLVWRLPVETRQMEARFTFNDLLLP